MKIIGHRGAAGLAPESTLASLLKALEYQVDGIEFDVRVTPDKIPVLQHDQEKVNSPDLPTLSEALAVIKNKSTAYVEIKPGEPIEPIVTVLKSAKAYDLRVGSKSLKTLLALRRAMPDAQLFVIEPWSGVRAHLRAIKVGTKLIFMNQRWLWWGYIRGFKNSGWELYAYTLNDPRKAKRWAGYGLAGVITDYPDRFAK